jgi:hypothetical protein
MKERSLTYPEIGMIAGSRFALGTGVGLLVFDRLNKDQRKGAGWTLLVIGILSSIPIGLAILRRKPASEKPMVLAA